MTKDADGADCPLRVDFKEPLTEEQRDWLLRTPLTLRRISFCPEDAASSTLLHRCFVSKWLSMLCNTSTQQLLWQSWVAKTSSGPTPIPAMASHLVTVVWTT